jgi:hypothetical protein
MSANPTPPLQLCCWNGTDAARADLRAQAALEDGRLHLGFSLAWQPSASPPQLPICQGSAGTPPQRRDGLWQHTCFEAFIAAAGSSAYWEFNLSPAGDWNVYRFDDYRAGQRIETAYQQVSLDLSCTQALLVLNLHCPLPPALLQPLQSGAALELGLTAVLEQPGGELSYWALNHPGPEPDFHDRRGWSLRL